MKRCLFLAMGFLLATSSRGQEAVHWAEEARLDAFPAVVDDALARLEVESLWVGYSIERLMYGSSRMGWFVNDQTHATLADILARAPAANDIEDEARRALEAAASADRLIAKQVALLFLMERGAAVPAKIRIQTLDSQARLDQPLLWLGRREVDESLAFVRSLWPHAHASIHEDLAAAIGMHDRPRETIPFLLATAGQSQDRDVQRAAAHWVASGVIMLMDLQHETRPEREGDREVRRHTLFALVHSDERAAPELMRKLIRESRNPDVRRGAIQQLGYLDDGAGLDALRELASALIPDMSRR